MMYMYQYSWLLMTLTASPQQQNQQNQIQQPLSLGGWRKQYLVAWDLRMKNKFILDIKFSPWIFMRIVNNKKGLQL